MSLRNKIFFATTWLLISISSASVAQERVDALDVKNSWVFSPTKDFAKYPTMVRFASNEEAEKLIKEITTVIGLPARFDVYRGPVGNAAARIEKGKRVIYYSQDWVSRIVKRDRWQAITLLAHEIGHHLASHTLTALSDQPLQELEADRFAGSIVARLGGNLDDAQRLYEQTSDVATITHPSRRERLEAVAVGWKDGGGENNTKATPKVVKTPTKVICGPGQKLIAGSCVARLRSKSKEIKKPRQIVCKNGQKKNSKGRCYTPNRQVKIKPPQTKINKPKPRARSLPSCSLYCIRKGTSDGLCVGNARDAGKCR